MDMGTHVSDTTTKQTIVRLKAWIGELNALLKNMHVPSGVLVFG
jgi:hypothetical protein